MGDKAKCPFFKYRRENFITCEGCMNSYSRTEYKSGTKAKEYYYKYCNRDWESCLQAIALNHLYERGLKE